MDDSRLQELVGKVVGDMGAAFGAATVVLGDRLGLWRAMAGAGPVTAATLARTTGTHPRLVAEWLAAQASAGYADYHDGQFALTEEQATVFADQSSPVFLTGLAEIISSVYRDEARLVAAYQGGAPLPWSDHDPALFSGTERFFRPGYAANLAASWIPALDGVADRLHRGARVADVGCGHGTSTVVLAQAYPASTFTGFDYHEPSVARARKLAVESGVADRVSFEVAYAGDYPGSGYDLVTICVPNALSQGDDPDTLGAQAGEQTLFEVAQRAGFSRTRRATATPFNLVLELRP